jgi:predicted RNA-binding Zn-ribbon protein involved in translation (DUF1610 family)
LEIEDVTYPRTTYYELTMSSTENYTFVCPECARSITVDSSTKDALIDHGCVVCGSVVSSDVFTPV